MAENPNSIGQIRELIFGETISQFEQRFKALEKAIALIEESASEAGKKRTELEARNAALEKKIEKTASDSAAILRNEIQAIRDSLNQRIDALSLSATDRTELSEWFAEISARLKNAQND